jgi:signal transduction histidine kinase
MAKFKASARVIDMLGRQQIAGIPTAINELFKNAHDAYADHVEIDFFRSDSLFVIRDDGMGMTPEEFDRRWLTLATESKLDTKQMPLPPHDPRKKKRPLLGEKGIGRLSLAVIGSQVIVLTRAKRDEKLYETVCAYIHWGIFEIPGVNLEDVDIPIINLKNGQLPNKSDIQKMVLKFSRQLENINKTIDSDRIREIQSELSKIDLDPKHIDNFLINTDYLSLKKKGYGTQFYIMPATELLVEDIDMGTPDKASPLEKALLGFTNTMTPEHSDPVIKASFRDYKLDIQYDDLIKEDNFFSPYEFENADHHLSGIFDEFGQFKGTIKIYGDEINNYIIPWKEARGKKTLCGKFKINIAVVQGESRRSTIPFDEYAKIVQKMNRIGGLYVYKNGIRILPYGNTDYDWLDIEFRRTKSAGYYYYSYRRMFGVIEIDNKNNKDLMEKSGREGFRENLAYRQFKSILKNFFLHTAADFFREAGSHSEAFFTVRNELVKQDEIRKKRQKRIRAKKEHFKLSIDNFFERYDKSEPQEKATKLIDDLTIKISNLKDINNKKEAYKELLFLEKYALRQLNQLKEEYKIIKPRIGLSKKLLKDWIDYQNTFLSLDEKVFTPCKKLIDEEIVNNANKARIEINKQIRIENALIELELETKKITTNESREARNKLIEISTEAKQRIAKSISKVTDTVSEVFAQFNKIHFNSLDDETMIKQRITLENKIISVRDFEVNFLRNLIEQFENISLDDTISSVDQIEALEQRIVYLEEQEEFDLQLTQLGMAIEIINHEFTSTVKSIRINLEELNVWAEHNEDLQNLFKTIYANFNHLDNYLNLFTPLNKRLYREKIEIKGSDIHKYISDLFKERFKRHDINLIVTKEFIKFEVIGYPSSFYPVFVNIADNAVYWLINRTGEKEIILDVLNKSFIISNNGPKILERDKKDIFELGFTRKPGGSGMGLYISKRNLNKINYDLVLLNDYIEDGVAFAITPKKKRL